MGTGCDVCIIWGLLGRPEAILTAPGSLSKAAGRSGTVNNPPDGGQTLNLAFDEHLGLQLRRAQQRLDSMKKTIAALTMCILISSPVWADGLIDGSAEAGKTKSVTCGACHGTDGNSVNPVWPSIAGQHSKYLLEQLQAFKGDPASGVAPTRDEALMHGQEMMLSDEDMRNLAVYYSELPAASKTVANPTTSVVNRGRKLYLGGNSEDSTPACIACHGPHGRGNPASSTPSIRGQYAVYTAKQLRDYASGARRSDGPTRVMRDIAAKLSEDDIKAVSSYVQGLQ